MTNFHLWSQNHKFMELISEAKGSKFFQLCFNFNLSKNIKIEFFPLSDSFFKKQKLKKKKKKKQKKTVNYSENLNLFLTNQNIKFYKKSHKNIK